MTEYACQLFQNHRDQGKGRGKDVWGGERDKKRQNVTGETFFQQSGFKGSLLGKTDFGSNHSSVIYCLWMIHSISILPM